MLPKLRNGSVLLEAIIGFPILVMALMAIVEFGLLSSNQAIVHAASRAGADAAVCVGCDLPESGAIPPQIEVAVTKVLNARGITPKCIRVEHTNGPSPPYVLETGTGASTPAADPPIGDYVCVSVCVQNAELAPNSLQLFCIDLEDSCSQQTVCRCLSSCAGDDGDGGSTIE